MKRRDTCHACHQLLPFTPWAPPTDAGARYAAGETLLALALEYSVSVPTLRVALMGRGVSMRTRGPAKGRAPKCVRAIPASRLAAMQKMRAAGATLKVIGVRFDQSRQAVADALKRHSKNGAAPNK